MMKQARARGAAVAVVAATALQISSAFGQAPPQLPTVTSKTGGATGTSTSDARESVEQLEQRILDLVRTKGREKVDLEAVEEVVLLALQEGRFVTDRAVLLVLQAWIVWENRFASSPTGAQKLLNKRSESKRFIDRVVPLLHGREELYLKLLEEKALLWRDEGNATQQVETFGKVVEMLGTSSVNLDVRRMTISYLLADALSQAGDKQQADRLFLEVYRYPWWKIDEARAADKLRRLYIDASKQLIELRRDNLEGLKQLRFTPGMKGLKLLLEDAIKEAERKAGGLQVLPPK